MLVRLWYFLFGTPAKRAQRCAERIQGKRLPALKRWALSHVKSEAREGEAGAIIYGRHGYYAPYGTPVSQEEAREIAIYLRSLGFETEVEKDQYSAIRIYVRW